MFKKDKNSNFKGRICTAVAAERYERIDILCDQNAESVKHKLLKNANRIKPTKIFVIELK